MNKLGFMQHNKHLYLPRKIPEIVEVPVMRYLMFYGQGMPGDNPQFQKAFQYLYGMLFTIKFMPKKGYTPPGYQNFKAAPPEALWWMHGNQAFSPKHPGDWRWILMIRVPDFVNDELVARVAAELSSKKDDPGYLRVHIGTLAEGKAVQIMHLGPYDSESESIKRMEIAAKFNGYEFTGRHHEIYLSDPRRTTPEKLRTVLRHPLKPIEATTRQTAVA